MTITHGLHRMTADEYHAEQFSPIPLLSNTIGKILIGQSPLHAWTQHPKLNPQWEPTESATFDIGRAAHRAILGAGGEYVAYPSDMLAANGAISTKAAKEWAAEQREAGRTPLKADDVDLIGAIAASAARRLTAMGITLDPARSEMVALAEIDGVSCKAMIDNAPADPRLPLYDVKTCEDANPDAVIRAVCNYGYDFQAAWYLDTWRAATGETRRFRFVFVEKSPPHSASVIELHGAANDSADWMDDARGKTAEARRLWAECLSTGVWPDYPARVAIVGAPSWHRAKWENRTPTPTASPATIASAAAWQAPERMKA